MHPTLFRIGDFEVGTYGLMVAIGIYCAMMLGGKRATRFGLTPDHVASLAVWTVVAGIVGGRITYILVEWEGFLANPVGTLFSREGFVFHGSLIGGTLAAWIWSRRKGISFWDIADMAAPAIALAHGFGRIGCFLNGCCHGRPTDLPWPLAVHFPHLTGLGVHPTQLYSSLANFALCALLIVCFRSRRFPGQVFLTYGFLYAGIRFLIEFLRAHPGATEPFLSSTQYVCLAGLAVLPILYYTLYRRSVQSRERAGILEPET